MYNTIVVGTDGSETAGEAVRQAVELAKLVGATLHLVTGGEPRFDDPLPVGDTSAQETAAQKIVRAAAAKLDGSGVPIETHSVVADGATAITDVADKVDADLIVVGNRGISSPKRFLLGSVPTKVAHYAPCSVLIVRTT